MLSIIVPAYNEEEGIVEILKELKNVFKDEDVEIICVDDGSKDKTAELASEFENAAGTLGQLTKKQLESLDAKLKILDSTWEKFILDIENGDGVLSKLAGGAIRIVTIGIDSFGKNIESLSLIFSSNLKFVERWKISINTLSRSFSLLNPFVETGTGFFDKEVDAIKKGNKGIEERKQLAEELVDLLIKDAETKGIVLNRDIELGKLSKESNEFIRDKIGLIEGEAAAIKKSADEKQAIEDAKKAKELTDKLERDKSAEEKKKDDATKLKEQREQEKKDLATFEQDKINLLNEIEISKAEDEERKKILKEEQKLEADLLELENLQISDEAKFELSELLYDAHLLRIQEITDFYEERKAIAEEKAAEEKEKRDTKAAAAEIALKKKTNKSIIDGAINLVGQQTKLGQALIAIKGLFAAKETLIDLGILQSKIATNTAGATADIAAGAAKTAKVGFPQNIPLLIAFAAQVSGIISAIKGAAGGAKNVSVPKFYEGGQVPTGTGGTITGSNIPTQQGGDNILATVKSGEVILNEDQQARAGGHSFFKSIGVPGFATGGIASLPTNDIQTPSGIDLNTLGDIIAEKVNDIKIVAIEQDITSAQLNQVEIVDGASF